MRRHRMLPKPRTPAPSLTVDTVHGREWSLSEREQWTMIVFYRGLHCPVCQAYLRQMDRHVDEFREIGVELSAVHSGEERTMNSDTSRHATENEALDCWSHGLAHLIFAYGVDRALELAAASVLDIADNREGFATELQQPQVRRVLTPVADLR
jgi:peroxiredoxin